MLVPIDKGLYKAIVFDAPFTQEFGIFPAYTLAYWKYSFKVLVLIFKYI